MKNSFINNFNLKETQESVDFFNIDIHLDTKIFVDPFCITKLQNKLGSQMQKTLNTFMYKLLNFIQNKDDINANKLCSHFSEPTGTRLGYSKINSDGSGAGKQISEKFVDSLVESDVVQNGIAKHLEELPLVCSDIGKDRISDITINIVKLSLIEFTQMQCKKHGVPMMITKDKLEYYCHKDEQWKSDNFELPHVKCNKTNKSNYLILVPKLITPDQVSYNYQYFYTNIAMDYYKREAIKNGSEACFTLKNGEKRVSSKKLREDPKYQGQKDKMIGFILKNPESLADYRRLVAPYVFEKNKQP